MTDHSCRCTCFYLRRAARRASLVYDHELANVGLSLNEYSILRRAEDEPRQIGALAAILGMDRSTLSRNLGPMIEAGWIEQRCSEDARKKLIGVSTAGRRLIRRARPHWQRAQDRIEALYGTADTDALHAALERLDRVLDHSAQGVAA